MLNKKNTPKLIFLVLIIISSSYVFSQNVASLIPKSECGDTKGKIIISLDESLFEETWSYPMSVQLQNRTTYEYFEDVIENENDKVIDNLPIGEYTVTIDFNDYCSIDLETRIEKELFIKLYIDPLVFASYKSSCNGDNSGKLGVYANKIIDNSNVSHSNLKFSWDNGSTKWFISNLTPGSYCVTATDLEGHCKTSECFKVEEQSFDIQMSGINPNNCSNPNGSVDVTPSNNSYNYKYSWSNGATTQNISNLIGGEYCVTVTTTPGFCSVTKCFELEPLCCNNNLTITPTIIKGLEGGPNLPSGSIEVNVSGGSGDYHYEWKFFNKATQTFVLLPKQNISKQVNLASNIYTVVVTDNITGCIENFIVVYTTFDTISNSTNDSLIQTSCDLFYGFKYEPTPQSRERQEIKEIDKITLNQNSLVVYPNPSNGTFSLRFNSLESLSKKVSIKSPNGNVIYTKEIEVKQGINEVKIEDYKFSSGFYLVEIENPGFKPLIAKMIIIQ